MVVSAVSKHYHQMHIAPDWFVGVHIRPSKL